MCDIIMLIFGIITLVRGRFLLTRAKEVRGAPARIIGVVLMLPFPLSFALGLVLGIGLATQGKSIDDVRALAVGLGFGVTVLCLIAAIVIAIVYARPIVKYAPDIDREDLYGEEFPSKYKDHFDGKPDDASPDRSESEDYTDRPVHPKKRPDDRIQE